MFDQFNKAEQHLCNLNSDLHYLTGKVVFVCITETALPQASLM